MRFLKLIFIILLIYNCTYAKDLNNNKDDNDYNFFKSCKQFRFSKCLKNLWGNPADNTIELGMASLHMNLESIRVRNWNNRLLGINYHGFLIGTFINSYYNRSYIFGLERFLYKKKYKNFSTNIGYMLGGVYGYKQDENILSKYSPVIPMLSLFTGINYRSFGVRLSYNIYVFSLSGYIEF